MAGIKVPQHKIFKITTGKLKYAKWDLTMTKREAFENEELIPLFQGNIFRAISIVLKSAPERIDYSKYLIALVIDNKADFKRANNKKGFKVNGKVFRRFVGTTGGLKGNTVLYVSEDIYDDLYKMSECGRNKDIPFVPAKLEAYRALFCSASQKIINPSKILVISDAMTKFKDTVIKLDDTGVDEPNIEVLKDYDVENNATDGFNLCTIEYMRKVQNELKLDYTPSGVCMRNAWLKGMLYPFPIKEFFDEYRPNDYMVKDIWGNEVDIRQVDMILTESSLKLWKCYDSIDDYIKKYTENGFVFSVTKIMPKVLEDYREVNYQYLQSYELSDDDISELCEPTIKYLKDSMCGDYHQTIKFLGIDGKLNDSSWQQALYTNEYMLNDPYIIDSVHKMIKRKIDDAKMGKLKIEGNYQTLSGDPFIMMQRVAGLEETGILKANEVYSKYWIDKNVDDIVVFRSPMTAHNNIRRCKVNNSDMAMKWYRYMNTIMIINAWDTFCMAENGADNDGDSVYSTNNNILLNRHKTLPAIMCVQRNVEKIIPKEEDIVRSNLNGMGNQVGQITNRVTNMMEVQSRFDKDSKEYNVMQYRISCGQLYQQNEIDKIKGIDFKPMPRRWYSIKDCTKDEDKLLCADKKPYFFIYNYDYMKRQYTDYIKSSEEKCQSMFGLDLDTLKTLENKTDEQQNFIEWYDRLNPVGMGRCTMNKICWYIESQFVGYKFNLKHNGMFDYSVLKVKRRCTEDHREKLKNLCDEYVENVKEYKKDNCKSKKSNGSENVNNIIHRRIEMRGYFRECAKEICPNDDERLNIILDMCYGTNNNRQFCWDCIGDLICKRLEEMNSANQVCNE